MQLSQPTPTRLLPGTRWKRARVRDRIPSRSRLRLNERPGLADFGGFRSSDQSICSISESCWISAFVGFRRSIARPTSCVMKVSVVPSGANTSEPSHVSGSKVEPAKPRTPQRARNRWRERHAFSERVIDRAAPPLDAEHRVVAALRAVGAHDHGRQ
jgi:hypothetical protein